MTRSSVMSSKYCINICIHIHTHAHTNTERLTGIFVFCVSIMVFEFHSGLNILNYNNTFFKCQNVKSEESSVRNSTKVGYCYCIFTKYLYRQKGIFKHFSKQTKLKQRQIHSRPPQPETQV